jgi:cytochrome c biogenesis protein CcmG/thiol:disulfide interchange protein DsbE
MDAVSIPENNAPETQENTVRTRRIGWGIVFLLVIGLLVMIYLQLDKVRQGPIGKGDEVPNFTLTTFNNEQVTLEEHRGKVVLLNFWASWCKPCEQEAADLEMAWRFYQPRGDVLFLGVDYVDTEPEALAYLEKFEITYPNGPDLGTRISQQFRIRGVPETYIIDQQGRLVDFQIGPFTSLNQIKAKIDPLLTP